MAKPTAQQCHAATTYFVKKFEEVNGWQPVVNRNKARWGFEAILMDFSPTETRQFIDYYLKYYTKLSIDWFLFNYDKVIESYREHEKNEKIVAQRREETAQRLEEWRNRWQTKKD